MNSVNLFLNGFLSIHDGLICYKKNNIIQRINNNKCSKTVKLITGGGSGHEPAHAGYIGYGMLTTVVCGDIFTSPSVTSILNGILLTGDKTTPIILIVMNYTGDRINFGLACEIARTKYGYTNIRTVLVNDDCSIESEKVQKSVGKRGLAGTILLNKILGAMAELGFDIDECVSFVERILKEEQICTIGFTFTSNPVNLSLSNIELGKGVHGEPGVCTIDECPNFDEIIEKIIEKFLKKIKVGSHIVILFNNLGGTSEFLFNVFAGVFLERITRSYQVTRTFIGTFITSLKQEGVSVSILDIENSTSSILEYLDFETNIPFNGFGTNTLNRRLQEKSVIIADDDEIATKIGKIEQDGGNGVCLSNSTAVFLEAAIISVCNVLIENLEVLNKIDREFGDGDTGTTLSKGAVAILDAIQLKKLTFNYPKRLFQTMSELIQLIVGGTSGALYGLFFQSASRSFNDESTEVSLFTWLNALTFGNRSLVEYGMAQIGDRTMVDPLLAAEMALKKAFMFDGNLSNLECLKLFSKICLESAEGTIKMIPKSGRASYTFAGGEDEKRSCEFPDPGAFAVGLWSQAIYDTFCSHF